MLIQNRRNFVIFYVHAHVFVETLIVGHVVIVHLVAVVLAFLEKNRVCPEGKGEVEKAHSKRGTS